MPNPNDQRPTAQDYADLFEVDKRGQRILDDLIRRFYRQPSKSNGIDRVLDSHEYLGRQQVLDFITDQIKRANGAPDDNQEEIDQ